MWFLIPVFGSVAAAGGTLALAGVYTSAANASSNLLHGLESQITPGFPVPLARASNSGV